jgi:hypothetical protein
MAGSGLGINKLLIIKRAAVPLKPLKTPWVPPTGATGDEGAALWGGNPKQGVRDYSKCAANQLNKTKMTF